MSLRILVCLVGVVVVSLTGARTAHADDGPPLPRVQLSVEDHGGTMAPLVLRYARAPAPAELMLRGGIAVAAVGAALQIAGLAVVLSNLGPSYEQQSLCGGDTECLKSHDRAVASADAKRAPGVTLGTVGVVTALVGGIAILVGAVTNQSSARVVRRASLLEGHF